MAAGCLRNTNWIIRTENFDASHTRNAVHTSTRAIRVQEIVGFCESPGDKSDTNVVRSSFYVDKDVLETRVDRGYRRGLLLVNGLHVLLAPNILLEDPGAIDGHDERMRILEAAHVAPARKTRDIELVFAVGWKQMLGNESSARTQRQTLDMHTLVVAPRRTEDRAGGLRFGVANRLIAHQPRGRYVLVEKRRGHFQNIGDVVEAICFVIFGKQRAGIHAQCDKILDRVGIFDA